MSTPTVRWTETEVILDLKRSCDLSGILLRAVDVDGRDAFETLLIERRVDDPLSLRRGKIRLYIRITEEG